MVTRRVAGAIALWVGLVGFLLGCVTERIWFDEALGALLWQLEDDERRVHARLMQLEIGATKR